MRLNLGCSDDVKEGWTNVDIYGEPPIVQADLRTDWPWSDSSVEQILAHDIFEHLPDKIHTMNEAWRVLVPTGVVDIVVPSTSGPGAFQDPTHVSFWNERSFLYYLENNIYRTRFAAAYGIQARFNAVEASILDTVDGPKVHVLLSAVK